MVNHPADGLLAAIQRKVSIENLMTYELGFTDEPGSQIDGQWWCLDQLFPMKARPMTARDSALAQGYYMGGNVETIYRWAKEGINIAKVYLEETKKRGIECFYSYRISDGTSHTEFGKEFAEAHPDWVVKDEWGNAKWNFAVPEVRARKLSILRELAEDYDFDGLEVDFARGPNNLPAGRMWANRRAVSQFLRDLRAVTLKVAKRRGRPFLVAARIPDTLVGCHFDGLDVETWVQDNLVDILVLGVRSYELEIERFRHVIGNKPIKIYATLDDHHCTDGYSWPPIEVQRGVAANWWQQGIDALQAFNWAVASPEVREKTGMFVHQAYFDDSDRVQINQQAYKELGSPETLRFLDKTFVVQRRGGGGSGGTQRARVEDTPLCLPEHQHAGPVAGAAGQFREGGHPDSAAGRGPRRRSGHADRGSDSCPSAFGSSDPWIAGGTDHRQGVDQSVLEQPPVVYLTPQAGG